MPEVRKIIGQNISKACKIKGIRQKDIAAAMNVSEGSVSNWIKGTNSLDLERLVELCRFLGVTLDQIFGFESLEDNALTDEELRILKLYRGADQAAQQIAIEILESHQDRKKDQALA